MDRNTKNGATTPQIMVSKEDAEMIETVHHILDTGQNVEIKQDTTGKPKILMVTKKIIKHN